MRHTKHQPKPTGNARYVRIDSKTLIQVPVSDKTEEEVREAYLAKIKNTKPWIMSMGVTPYQVD